MQSSHSPPLSPIKSIKESPKHAGELHMSWPKKGGGDQSQEFTIGRLSPFLFLNASTLPLLAALAWPHQSLGG